MPSVMVCAPNPHDASSFYRAWGPMTQLRQIWNSNKAVVDKWGVLEIIDPGPLSELTWANIARTDIVMLQRPHHPEMLAIARTAKAVGRFLWVDMDDNLLEVPTDNPMYEVFHNGVVQSTVLEILKMADVVTVSTHHLAAAMATINPNVRVIANAHDDRVMPVPDVRPMKKIVLWRGSKTHERDLKEYAPAILESARDNPDWQFYFMGYNPWFITEQMRQRQGKVIFQSDFFSYFRRLHELSAAIMIVPLHDSHFNRSKSNIAWIEGTGAGAACLVPKFESWDGSSKYRYTGIKSFKDQLCHMMAHVADGSEHHTLDDADHSWARIEGEFLLQTQNWSRMGLINDAISGGKERREPCWQEEQRAMLTAQDQAQRQAAKARQETMSGRVWPVVPSNGKVQQDLPKLSEASKEEVPLDGCEP